MKNLALAFAILGGIQAHAANLSHVKSVECVSAYSVFKFDFVNSTMTRTRFGTTVETISDIHLDQTNQLIAFITQDGLPRLIKVSGSGDYGYADAELLDENGEALLECVAKIRD